MTTSPTNAKKENKHQKIDPFIKQDLIMITIKLFYRSYQINYFLPFSWQSAPSKITPQWDRKDETKKNLNNHVIEKSEP